MADKFTIQDEVEIRQSTRESVAFDLMEKIAYNESSSREAERGKREYWLTLYVQCLKATRGYKLESVLKGEE